MSHLVLVRTPWLDPSGHMHKLRLVRAPEALGYREPAEALGYRQAPEALGYLVRAPEALGYRQAFGITCARQICGRSVARQARCCRSGLHMTIYIHDCTRDYIYDWIYDYM